MLRLLFVLSFIGLCTFVYEFNVKTDLEIIQYKTKSYPYKTESVSESELNKQEPQKEVTLASNYQERPKQAGDFGDTNPSADTHSHYRWTDEEMDEFIEKWENGEFDEEQ